MYEFLISCYFFGRIFIQVQVQFRIRILIHNLEFRIPQKVSWSLRIRLRIHGTRDSYCSMLEVSERKGLYSFIQAYAFTYRYLI
jgi:hypothetical protein